MAVDPFTLVAGRRHDPTQVDLGGLVVWLLMHLLRVLSILGLLILHLVLLHEKVVVLRHLWLYHEIVCHGGTRWSVR